MTWSMVHSNIDLEPFSLLLSSLASASLSFSIFLSPSVLCLCLSPSLLRNLPAGTSDRTIFGYLFLDSNPNLRYVPQDEFDPYDGHHGDYAPMMAQNLESHPDFDQSNMSEYSVGYCCVAMS